MARAYGQVIMINTNSSLNGADGVLEHVSFPFTDECTGVFMTSPACMKVGPDLPRPLLLA